LTRGRFRIHFLIFISKYPARFIFAPENVWHDLLGARGKLPKKTPSRRPRSRGRWQKSAAKSGEPGAGAKKHPELAEKIFYLETWAKTHKQKIN
jgi:hypothetical protein